MILPRNYWEKNILEMKEESYNYLVIKVDHLDFSDDRKPFENGIQVLNLCNSLRMANKFFEKLGVKQNFDFNILYDVQKSIINDEPFSIEDLKKYFELMKEVEKFARASEHIFPATEHWFVDTSTEMSLIGFSLESQAKLESLNANKFGFLSDEFFKLSYEVIEDRKTVEAFKKEAKNLCDEYLKAEKKEKYKRAA